MFHSDKKAATSTINPYSDENWDDLLNMLCPKKAEKIVCFINDAKQLRQELSNSKNDGINRYIIYSYFSGYYQWDDELIDQNEFNKRFKAQKKTKNPLTNYNHYIALNIDPKEKIVTMQDSYGEIDPKEETQLNKTKEIKKIIADTEFKIVDLQIPQQHPDDNSCCLTWAIDNIQRMYNGMPLLQLSKDASRETFDKLAESLYQQHQQILLTFRSRHGSPEAYNPQKTSVMSYIKK